MRSSFTLAVGVLIATVTAAPGSLMRGDNRMPADVKASGGFKAKSTKKIETADMPELLFESVTGNKGLIDKYAGSPFVSTTTDVGTARDGALKGCVYHLDSSKIKNTIWDVNAEFKKKGKKNQNSDEEEWAVEYEVPWAAVTKTECYDNGRYVEQPLPGSRANSPQNPQPNQPAAPKPTPKPNTPAPKPAPKPGSKGKGGKI